MSLKCREKVVAIVVLITLLTLSGCGPQPDAPVSDIAAPTAVVGQPAPTAVVEQAEPTTAPATPAPAVAQPKSGGVLKVAIQADVAGLDVFTASSYSSSLIFEQVYEGLLRYTPEMEIVPWLAESYEVQDALTYVFKLRPGVKFHNGEEMTAADVKYSYERYKDPDVGSPRAVELEAVESIETPDDDTVILHLAYPFSPLLSYLASQTLAIVPEGIAEEADLRTTLVGTGCL